MSALCTSWEDAVSSRFTMLPNEMLRRGIACSRLDITQADHAVLLAMLSWVDWSRHGAAVKSISQATLMSQTGLAKRSVQEAVKSLDQKGYVAVSYGVGHQRNRYRI